MKELIGRGGTACLDNAAIAEGTTVTVTIANAVSIAIDGKVYSIAASTNDVLNTTTDVTTGDAFVAQAVSTVCAYVYGANAAGETGIAKGSDVTCGDGLSDYASGYPQFPPLPDDFCPIGYIIVRNDSTGSAWTINTTNWTTTGITTAFTSVMTLPDRPQGPTTA